MTDSRVASLAALLREWLDKEPFQPHDGFEIWTADFRARVEAELARLGEPSPEGPWEVAPWSAYVPEGDWYVYLDNGTLGDERQIGGLTRAEAIAVRDALNGVSGVPREETK